MTLRRVARLSGVPLSKILLDVHRIAGIELTEAECATLAAATSSDGASASVRPRPEWVRDMSEDDVPVTDLRREEGEGASGALRSVAPGDVVLLKCSSEPRSLYAAWDRQGHDYFTEQMGAEEWWVFVRKEGGRREEGGGEKRHEAGGGAQ
jgi:hypothetical protein